MDNTEQQEKKAGQGERKYLTTVHPITLVLGEKYINLFTFINLFILFLLCIYFFVLLLAVCDNRKQAIFWQISVA